MKIAPLIHTRTYSCDFNSEFRVRPNTFMDSDVKWARKVVLEATSSIDSLQGERWLIADNGNCRIAGVVGFLKSICSHCNLTDEQRMMAEEMYSDDKGRLVYAFIGVVIDNVQAEDLNVLSYDYLWNTYSKLIRPVWKRRYPEVIMADFESVTAETENAKPNIESKKVDRLEMYESNPNMDYKLFSYYLCNRSMNNFSFCTNISDINAVKNCNFTIISTSSNVITRLNREVVQVVQSVQQVEINNEAAEGKKKSFVVFGIVLLIFVVIILILLLLT